MLKKNDEKRTRFAICLADDLPSLNARKVYRVLPDKKAEAIHWIRVVDDFDEDYLYPANDFIFIDLSPEAQRLMARTALPSRKASPRRKRKSPRQQRSKST